MKLKIGDKVKIKPYSFLKDNTNNIPLTDLKVFADKIVSIKKVLENDGKRFYKLEEDNNIWSWKPYQFEKLNNYIWI